MSLRREFMWALGLTAGMLMLFLYMEPAGANGDDYPPPPPPEPPVVTNVTEVTNITNEFDGNKFHSSLAATMAADAIHCTTSSRKHQMGIGLGNSDGHNGFAAGYCHSVEIKGQPFMLGVKATSATDTKPTYSVALNWTF